MKENTKNIIVLLITGLLVVIVAGLLVAGANAMMNGFLDAEMEDVRIAAEKAEEARQAALAAADEAEREKAEAMAEVLKYEQMETFYQKYKYRESYHYYGQFYEMFNNVYNADTIFIGTSHCAHGVNPLYIEEEITNHSFFNFGLNGSVPTYYQDWYDIYKNEAGYPIPETVIYCVDWFMCDRDWLWRRIDYDTPSNMALGTMRSLKKKADKSAEAEETESEEAQESAETEEVEVEKTMVQLLAESVRTNGWWNIEEHMTVFLLNTPIIAARDRIPEMLHYYLTGSTGAEAEEETVTLVDVTDTAEEVISLEIPTYTHKYLVDGSNNITSSYYKGYIPWDVDFGGGKTTVGCNFYESEWNAFLDLLDEFVAEGVNVIFVECPEYSGWVSADRKVYNKKLRDVAKEYGFTFLNYNDELASELNDDNENYSDWGHLSLKGSTEFSKVLAKDLKPLIEAFDAAAAE